MIIISTRRPVGVYKATVVQHFLPLVLSYSYPEKWRDKDAFVYHFRY